MNLPSPLSFRRRPNSSRFYVVSDMCRLGQHLKMASCFLSPSYQIFLTTIPLLNLYTFSTCLCELVLALETRNRPVKAGHSPPCISRWLVWTLACVKLNQGSQEVPLNYLMWFYSHHCPCYMCCSQHYSPASLRPPWTQDFASQSCVLISRFFPDGTHVASIQARMVTRLVIASRRAAKGDRKISIA